MVLTNIAPRCIGSCSGNGLSKLSEFKAPRPQYFASAAIYPQIPPQHPLPSPAMNKYTRVGQRTLTARSIISCRQSFSTSSITETLTEGEERTIDRLAVDIILSDASSRDDDVQNMTRRIALSKAITLVESKAPRKRLMADVLLEKLKQSTNGRRKSNNVNSFRLGIAGPPGVGKSTFVEALGLYVLGLNNDEKKEMQQQQDSCFQPEKLAVLCIDPSSSITGGSILGDKTRMSNLSYHPKAYVRPSPSSGTLGGLGSYTYDCVSLCEFAGYETTFIETVGVGQSEVELAQCCDLFLLLLAPGGGDELQGSKKGIVEVADILVVNKADGESETLARRTANEYTRAMGLLRKPAGWWGGKQNEDASNDCSTSPTAPPVLLVSAKTGAGLPELWNTILKYQQYAKASGHLSEKRRKQNRYWMWKYLKDKVSDSANKDPQRAEAIERSLDSGLVAPRVAASQLWKSIVDSAESENKV